MGRLRDRACGARGGEKGWMETGWGVNLSDGGRREKTINWNDGRVWRGKERRREKVERKTGREWMERK
jgi:hypothetical protein